MHTLDAYRTLYNRGASDEDRRRYIVSRRALADWIVMDDTFLDFYQHYQSRNTGWSSSTIATLVEGRLGVRLVTTFKVYPSLFGYKIIDDGAELTFVSSTIQKCSRSCETA